MSKEEHSIYWPGTKIVKSPNNCFTTTFGDGIDWPRATSAAAAGVKITASVERSRKEKGVDPGSFYGISRKSDEAMAITRHGGAYSRAKAKAPTKAARIRAFLADGPKTADQIGEMLGVARRHSRSLLCYDIEKGLIVVMSNATPVRYALSRIAA